MKAPFHLDTPIGGTIDYNCLDSPCTSTVVLLFRIRWDTFKAMAVSGSLILHAHHFQFRKWNKMGCCVCCNVEN